MSASLVGSEMCIRDREIPRGRRQPERPRKSRCDTHARARAWRTRRSTAQGEPPPVLRGGTRSQRNASNQPGRRGSMEKTSSYARGNGEG
eukprot:11648479-Alexandrium_andersonii.AAC.1